MSTHLACCVVRHDSCLLLQQAPTTHPLLLACAVILLTYLLTGHKTCVTLVSEACGVMSTIGVSRSASCVHALPALLSCWEASELFCRRW